MITTTANKTEVEIQNNLKRSSLLILGGTLLIFGWMIYMAHGDFPDFLKCHSMTNSPVSCTTDEASTDIILRIPVILGSVMVALGVAINFKNLIVTLLVSLVGTYLIFTAVADFYFIIFFIVHSSTN